MKSTLEVNGKAFEVAFSLFGNERYYYDGNLLFSRWSLKLNDRLNFNCEGRDVTISVAISTKKWSVQACIDGELAVEELFPEMKGKVEGNAPKKGCTKTYWAKTIILWFVVFFVMFAFFRFVK